MAVQSDGIAISQILIICLFKENIKIKMESSFVPHQEELHIRSHLLVIKHRPQRLHWI